MSFDCLIGSRVQRSVFLTIVFLNSGLGVAIAGLSEAERTTLEQPACAQMKSFSQDITLLNDEMQNVRRFGQRNRICGGGRLSHLNRRNTTTPAPPDRR